jgi:predicted dehydrogenase
MSMSRRVFLGTAAGAAIVAGTAGKKTVFGANDRVRIGVVACGGRAGSHLEAFTGDDGSEVVAICDPDARRVESRKEALIKATGNTPATYSDVRDLLADENVDAISIASPNHWHSLGAIWGLQAGKDVYVEKPLSHNIWEGRQLAALEAKSDRIVMHGTQSRSDARWMRDIAMLRDGFLGKVNVAKGFTYKTGNRRSIGYTEAENAPDYLDWEQWQGPASRQEYKSNYHPYTWHWFWHYGNGETGNQGVHQMDIAVWGMNRGLPVKAYSAGGRYKWDDEAETPNTQLSTLTYADGSMLEFEVRNVGSYEEAGKTTGNHFLCDNGYYVEDQGFFDYNHEPIKVETEMPETLGTWGNFLNAVRTRSKANIHGTAMDGHLSCAHIHIANISYRLGRSLEFDPETERFVNDDEANAMVSREYAKGFEVPAIA